MPVYRLRIEIPADIEDVRSEWMTFKKLEFANPFSYGDFVHLRNLNLGQVASVEHYHDGYKDSHSIVLLDTKESDLRGIKTREELQRKLGPLEDLIEFDF